MRRPMRRPDQIRGLSSVGRALPLQGRCQEFDSPRLHNVSILFEDLCDPTRQPVRPRLYLLDDEVAPTVVESERPHRVVWSSLWLTRPDARVQFDLSPADGGTDLR